MENLTPVLSCASVSPCVEVINSPNLRNQRTSPKLFYGAVYRHLLRKNYSWNVFFL